MRYIVLVFALALTACGKPQVSVVKTPPAQKVVTKSRSEPIFYNGKTYQLDYDYAGGAFAMRVSGMGPKQQKDAVAVATSSLGYFACPDGQKGRLEGVPSYDAGQWKMSARCG
jgi:hypothetical protein